MFNPVYIRLSPEDTRRLLEILYPGEPDPLRRVRESRRRRQFIARVVAVIMLLAAVVAAAPLVWPLLAILVSAAEAYDLYVENIPLIYEVSENFNGDHLGRAGTIEVGLDCSRDHALQEESADQVEQLDDLAQP